MYCWHVCMYNYWPGKMDRLRRFSAAAQVALGSLSAAGGTVAISYVRKLAAKFCHVAVCKQSLHGTPPLAEHFIFCNAHFFKTVATNHTNSLIYPQLFTGWSLLCGLVGPPQYRCNVPLASALPPQPHPTAEQHSSPPHLLPFPQVTASN